MEENKDLNEEAKIEDLAKEKNHDSMEETLEISENKETDFDKNGAEDVLDMQGNNEVITKQGKKKNKVVKGVGATVIDYAITAIISFILYSMKAVLKVFGLQVVTGSEVEFFILIMIVTTFFYYAICKSIKKGKTIGDILL